MDWRFGATACCVLSLAAAPASAVIDVVGSDHASFGWSPASGPVASYSVYVSTNGASLTLYSVVSGRTDETVQAGYGDTIVVQVAAADATGQEGPLSSPSPEVRFLAAAEPAPADLPIPTDFDGDGISDVWMPDPVNGRPMLWSLSSTSFTLEGELPTLPESWEMVATVDFDGNGLADLLWRDAQTGRLDVWLIDNGDIVGVGMVRGPDGADWVVAAADDFDGDGRADIMLRQPLSGDLELWLMDGTSVVDVVAWTDGPTGDYEVVSSGDYDANGRADLLWRAPEQGILEAWLANDALGFDGLILDPALDPEWEVSGSGDFGGDGRDEFLLRNRALGRLEIHSLDGLATTLPTPDPTWEVTALGDYDGDGGSDVLWRTGADGGYTAWLVDSAGDVTTRALADPFAIASGTGASSCPGDIDGDGVVSLNDFAHLGRCFGQAGTGDCAAADLDADGEVSWGDFSTFRSVFGAPCSAP